MKKIIRLNERELNNLIGKIIIETKRFNSQDDVDRILDKIGEFGIDSLTDEEKYIINNPDEEIDNDEESDDYDESHGSEIMYELIEKGLLRKKDVFFAETNDEGEDVFVVNSIETEDNVEFPYFALGEQLVFYCDDRNITLKIDFDVEDLTDDVREVADYIMDVWEPMLPHMKIDIKLNEL